MTLVFNCVAGPGSGKSTLAHGLMAHLKCRGHKAEFVGEYAKELTYAQDWAALGDQKKVTEEQNRRLKILVGQVDYIVQDCALPLGILYGQNLPDSFKLWVWELFESYRNVNCFVERVKPYQDYGRTQTKAEAIEKDDEIKYLFQGRLDLRLPGEEASVQKAANYILDYLPTIGDSRAPS